MEKTCNFDGYCTYKVLGCLFYGCAFGGYCDYQAPRDSRDEIEDEFGKAMEEGD